jgi:hypothetical protein
MCAEELLSREYHVGNSREENIDRTANLAILQLLKMLVRKGADQMEVKPQ